jgi:hypothetical protein
MRDGLAAHRSTQDEARRPYALYDKTEGCEAGLCVVGMGKAKGEGMVLLCIVAV